MWWLWLRVPNQDDPRLHPMGSQFSIPVLRNLYSKSVGSIKFWDPVEDWVWVRVEIPLEWNNYLLFNSDFVNFVVKTDQGEAESIVLLTFVFGGVLIVGGWGEASWGRKPYLGPPEIVFFPDGILSEAISMTHSDMLLYRLDISTFYCNEPLLFRFPSRGNFSKLGLRLSTITFIVNSYADKHFYKYIYLFQMFQILFGMKLVFFH